MSHPFPSPCRTFAPRGLLVAAFLTALAAAPPPEGRRPAAPAQTTNGDVRMSGVAVEPMTTGARPQGFDGRTISLFDGGSWLQWTTRSGEPSPWAIVDGAAVAGGGDAVTRRSFGDFQLHLEFRCPRVEGATGQARANSGVYLHGRYEVQVLDSYGGPPADDGCGAIFGTARPLVNASMPAEIWQSFDVVFRAPRFGEDGAMTERPRVTVLHNGVVIHNNVEIRSTTPGGLGEDMPAEGPLLLQDHGHPVRFRNIWIRPL